MKGKFYLFKNILIFFFILILLFLIIQILFASVNPWPKDYTKYTLLEFIPNKYKLKNYIYNENNEYNIVYPIIIKPAICSGINRSVELLKNKMDLEKYKKGMKKNEIYILQEYYNSNYEVGLLYEKIPNNKNGTIISIVSKKKFDKNNWKALRCKNINSNTNGVPCEDYTYMISKELTDVINNISNQIPNFYAGRYDIGFDNIDDFKKGKNFKIYEINGVMGFDLRTLINEIYIKEKYYIIRWTLNRYYIGLLNIIYGNVNLLNMIKNLPNMYKNYNNCNDWEKLFESSPA